MEKVKKSNVVLLGYEDELVTEKNEADLGYWINKVGGYPDWPVTGVSSPKCRLCGLLQPLVVQIYAPLEHSPFHRTLYVFSCVNPNCWNHNESWTCVRSQVLDPDYDEATPSTVTKSVTDWGVGADDWGLEADDWDDDNGNIENGKPIKSDNESDDDSSSLSAAVGNLNVDELNANYANSGAVGKKMPPVATAEIEKEENEVVSIDTPIAPEKDLVALLQEAAPVPSFLTTEGLYQNCVAFESFFISVGKESFGNSNSDHIRDLLHEYKKNHGGVHKVFSQKEESGSEDYEKALPAHGDKTFHHFLSRIQANPGQLLRYSIEGAPPLLLYPLQEKPRKCNYCNGDVVFEMQLLPTLISKLRFPNEDETRVEFGTVLIFTCSRSCWSTGDKVREEYVIVQAEKT